MHTEEGLFKLGKNNTNIKLSPSEFKFPSCFISFIFHRYFLTVELLTITSSRIADWWDVTSGAQISADCATNSWIDAGYVLPVLYPLTLSRLFHTQSHVICAAFPHVFSHRVRTPFLCCASAHAPLGSHRHLISVLVQCYRHTHTGAFSIMLA